MSDNDLLELANLIVPKPWGHIPKQTEVWGGDTHSCYVCSKCGAATKNIVDVSGDCPVPTIPWPTLADAAFAARDYIEDLCCPGTDDSIWDFSLYWKWQDAVRCSSIPGYDDTGDATPVQWIQAAIAVLKEAGNE